MAAPLYGRRPKRKPRPPRRCMAACGAEISRWKWLCDRCFAELPFHDRKAIAEAGHQGSDPARRYGLCRAAAEFLINRRAQIAAE
jgi:predicted amidophosphoribosyltransferase